MTDTEIFDFSVENTDREEIIDLTKELLIRNKTNLIEKKVFDDTFYDFYMKKTVEYLKILEKNIDDIEDEEYFNMFCLILFPRTWKMNHGLPDNLLDFITTKREFLNLIKFLLELMKEEDCNKEYTHDYINALELVDDILKDEDKINDVFSYCRLVMFLFYEGYFKNHEDELPQKETIPFNVKDFPMDLIFHTLDFGLEKNQGKPKACTKEENIIELKKLKKSLIKDGKKPELEFILKIERECNLSFERY